MERLTAEEFDALRPRLGRVSVNTMEIARAVLVDGVRQSDAATRYGMTRQRINGILRRFAAASQGVPTGWRRVEVWLPPDLAEQVEAMAYKTILEHRSG